VKDEPAQFFRKRFTRVVIPFIFWCIAYSFYQFFRGQVDFTTACTNILKIPVNFGTQVGHLWYVYMLMGLYFFVPIILLCFITVLTETIGLYNRRDEYPQNPGKLRDTSGASLVCLYADGTISFRSYHFTLVKNSFSKEHRAISWNMGVYFVRALYPSVISGYI